MKYILDILFYTLIFFTITLIVRLIITRVKKWLKKPPTFLIQDVLLLEDEKIKISLHLSEEGNLKIELLKEDFSTLGEVLNQTLPLGESVIHINKKSHPEMRFFKVDGFQKSITRKV